MDLSAPNAIDRDNTAVSHVAIATPNKRQHEGQDEQPNKRFKPMVEVPQVYSEAVRKKLASTSRTGQACDRCKERKMKCDTDPIACGPCRQKSLRCYTTDRVTGQSRERGQTDRAESELQFLRDQHAAYHRKYGPLQPADLSTSTANFTPVSEPGSEHGQHFSLQQHEKDRTSSLQSRIIPSSQYVGWPAPSHIEELHHGPVNGTVVDILDGFIDIGDFECEMMQEYPQDRLNVFNVSRTSIVNTTTGYQTIVNPRFPPKDEALRDANSFLVIMSQYVPVVHRPSFLEMVHRIYDQPSTVKLAEQVQLAVALGIISFQTAVRNHHQAVEKFEQSHYWIHYGLTWYRELLRERSLASMQALALILVHFRNLPKPGYAWSFGHNLLCKAMELDYHRDPDKVTLPPGEDTLLAKELRKRVFHSILGICVTTACRVNKPAPWKLEHMDVPLPRPIKDTEIDKQGLVETLSGRCDYWPCLHLAKLLPLLTEMYNHVTSVRLLEADYLKVVEVLHAKIEAWRKDWDESTRQEENHANLEVASLLIETWAAEYTLNLYHPSLCPNRSPEIMDKHLEICHRQAQRLLKSFHILSSKFKGVDFTWHSTAAYAMGFGVTLHVYRQKRGKQTHDQFQAMKNELKGWMSLVAYADLVMRTGNRLQHLFEPRVSKLEADSRHNLLGSASEPRSHPHNMPTPSAPGSSLRSLVKNEASPGPRPSSTAPDSVEPSSSLQRQPQITVSYMSDMPGTGSWSTPRPYMHTTTSVPPFTAYGPVPGDFQPVPTSLAPLLNEPPTAYMDYPTHTSAAPNDTMMFAPNHYSINSSVAWPYITLSPHEQTFSSARG